MASDASKALTKNRVFIVKNVANPDDVADHLYSMKLFTDDMLATVKQEPEKEKKTRCILDILKYRGKKAPRGLYDALMETENQEVAEAIAPYLTAAEEEDNKYSPTKWPPEETEQKRMESDPVVKITDLKHPNFYFKYTKEKVYKMKNKIRGKVLIINNVEFIKFGRRDGSDKDAENITQLFKELHFDVVQRDNLKKQEMLDFLTEERNKIRDGKHDDIECLVLVIMSHGHTIGVYGVDEQELELKTMTDLFTSVNCPSLNEKPRLVFVQACRGDKREQRSDDSKDVLDDKMKDLKVTDSKNETDAVPSCVPLVVPTVHSAADFLIAYATPEGTPAYRNIKVGSWFINAIVWTFKYHAHKEELHRMLVMVNDLVSAGTTLKGELTVAEKRDSLRKEFYFFPGVYGDPPTTF